MKQLKLKTDNDNIDPALLLGEWGSCITHKNKDLITSINRKESSFYHNGFLLSREFNWDFGLDSNNDIILVPTKKIKLPSKFKSDLYLFNNEKYPSK